MKIRRITVILGLIDIIAIVGVVWFMNSVIEYGKSTGDPGITFAVTSVATSSAQLDKKFRAQEFTLPAVNASAGTGLLTLNVNLPDGWVLNDQAPFTLHVYNDQVVAVKDSDNNFSKVTPKMPIT